MKRARRQEQRGTRGCPNLFARRGRAACCPSPQLFVLGCCSLNALDCVGKASRHHHLAATFSLLRRKGPSGCSTTGNPPRSCTGFRNLHKRRQLSGSDGNAFNFECEGGGLSLELEGLEPCHLLRLVKRGMKLRLQRQCSCEEEAPLACSQILERPSRLVTGPSAQTVSPRSGRARTLVGPHADRCFARLSAGYQRKEGSP